MEPFIRMKPVVPGGKYQLDDYGGFRDDGYEVGYFNRADKGKKDGLPPLQNG